MDSQNPAAAAQAENRKTQPDTVEGQQPQVEEEEEEDDADSDTQPPVVVERWHEAVDAVLQATRAAFPSSPALDAAAAELEPSVRLESAAGVTKGTSSRGWGRFSTGRACLACMWRRRRRGRGGEGQRTGVLVHGADWMSEGGSGEGGERYVYTGGWIGVLASERPDVHINCLVRSRSKLERMHPDIVNSTSRQINVFEGQVSDVPLLTDCIRGTSAVFMCVATPYNQPHLRIARDQAEAVVAALEALRAERQQQQQQPQQKIQLPLLVVLTSAEKYLRERSGLADVVFMKPGGITTDSRRGHVLSTRASQTFVSFLDVAGGMVQCAEEGAGRWAGQSVSVLSRGKARFGWSNGPLLFKNMACTWVPWLYPWLF